MGCGGSVNQYSYVDYETDPYQEGDRGWARAGSKPSTTWSDPVIPISGQFAIGGEWQFEESPDTWVAFSPEVSAQLLVAWYCGDTSCTYSAAGTTFEVDLQSCLQTDLQTGQQQRIGFSSSQTLVDETVYEESPPDGGAADGVWVEYNGDQANILAAWAAGHTLVYYHDDGCDYEIDFVRMLETNLVTGAARYIGFQAVDGAEDGASDESTVQQEFDSSAPRAEVHVTAAVHASMEASTATSAEDVSLHSQPTYASRQSQPYSQSGREVGPHHTTSLQGSRGGPYPMHDSSEVPSVQEHLGHAQAGAGSVPTAAFAAPGAEPTASQEPPRGQDDDWKPQRKSQKKWTLGPEQRPKVAGNAYLHTYSMTNVGSERTAQPNSRVPSSAVPPPGAFAPHGAFPAPGTFARAEAQRQAGGGVQPEATAPPPVGTSGRTKQSETASGYRSAEKAGHSAAPQPGQPRQPPHAAQQPPGGGPSAGESHATAGSAAAGTAAGAGPGSVPGPRRPPPRQQESRRPRVQKKWTLGPEKTSKPRVDFNTAAPPPGYSHSQRGGHGSTAQAGQGGQPGGASPPRQGRPGESSEFVLPTGVTWPSDPKARRVVETLVRDMQSSKAAPMAKRRQAYKIACLSWHPDKNQKHVALATEIFQFLQSLKAWYLEE
mmetsp:Transcript_7315/g.18283  ORF Transcript_7315/g.18283 Transcript_7315/m.18283 type:complete len:658 (-) Transcript_7315:44-2017(-)